MPAVDIIYAKRIMFVLIIGKLLADIMNGGLWGNGSIDYALLMPQKVRQLMPNG